MKETIQTKNMLCTIILPDGATDGCFGVLVRDVLSCFVSSFSILPKNRELFHQRNAHEHQGHNS